jgi:hypothetical protein
MEGIVRMYDVFFFFFFSLGFTLDRVFSYGGSGSSGGSGRDKNGGWVLMYFCGVRLLLLLF